MRRSWLLLLVAACSSSDPSPAAPIADAGVADAEPEGCPTGGTGSLDLQIVGSDAPEEWPVTVEGVDEHTSERVGSTTFLRLPTGRYHVIAETVTTPVPQGAHPSLVRRVLIPNVSTPLVCVRADKTPIAHVVYSSLPTDGALFMAHENATGQVARLSLPSMGLLRSTVDTFDVRTPAARGLAFDAGGNLWVAGDGVVERIPGPSLQVSGVGQGTPDRRLDGSLFAGTSRPTALAFDAEGDLWVSLPGAKTIVELVSSSLSVSGAPTANVVIDSAAFVDLPAMAFDKSGDLFLASGDHVLRYRGARLAASTSAPADVDVTTKWKGIRDLSFDVSGNLWVAYSGSDVLARLEPGDLDGVGAREVIPRIELTLATRLGHGSAKLGRLGPEQLAASATVTPDQFVEGIRLGIPSRLAFFPAAKGTPLYAALP
jgi:hypothetical protein